jgi:NADH-quinone oxidoreductase subunit I
MGVIKVARPPKDKNIFLLAYGYFSSLATGMWMTLKIFVRQLVGIEKTDTLEWPEAPAPYGERFKGRHFLTKRPDGQVRCTACFLCATACPAQCIHIEAGEHRTNTIEKYPVRFEIDILRCVFCGFCEEACPVDAIRLGPEYAMSGPAEQKWVYTKDFLVDRSTLQGGIHSIKSESVKHGSVDNPQVEGRLKTEIPHHHH